MGQTFNLPSAGGALLVGTGAWTAYVSRRLWARHPALLALVAGVVGFYALAALGRDGSTVSAGVSRYVYVAVALLVPLMGKLLSPARASGGAVFGAVGLLALTALGNVGQAQSWASARVALTSASKVQVVATGRLLGEGCSSFPGPPRRPSPPAQFGGRTARRLARSDLLPDTRCRPSSS